MGKRVGGGYLFPFVKIVKAGLRLMRSRTLSLSEEKLFPVLLPVLLSFRKTNFDILQFRGINISKVLNEPCSL